MVNILLPVSYTHLDVYKRQAIAYTIDAKGLNLIAAIIAGSIGAGTFNGNVASTGNPIAAFVAVIGAVEVTRLIQGKTPVDILLVPFVSILIGGIITLVVGPYLTEFILWLGQLINTGVSMQPILMSVSYTHLDVYKRQLLH